MKGLLWRNVADARLRDSSLYFGGGWEDATPEPSLVKRASELPPGQHCVVFPELGAERLRDARESCSRLWARGGLFDRVGQDIVVRWDKPHSWNVPWQEDTMFPVGQKLERELARYYLGSCPVGLSGGVRRPWQAEAERGCLASGLRKGS